MIIKRKWVLGLGGLACMLAQGVSQAQPASAPIGVPAGGAQALSLPAAMQAAVVSHPRIRTSVGLVAQASEGIAAAKAGYYPVVRGGIGSELSNRDIAPYDSRRVHQASLSVTQMLYDFGKVASTVSQAEAGVSAARAQAMLSIDEVAREAALAWVELYRQQALERIAGEQVTGVKALAALVNERERQGASSRSDVVQASARVDAALAQQLSAQAQLQRWRSQLMYITGARAPVSIAGEAPAVLAQACQAQVAVDVLQPPGVQLAMAQREAAQAELRLADANLMPTLSLDGSVRRGLDARSRLPGDNGLSSSVSLNFSAPLYEGGANQARQRAAAHALVAADAAIEQARLQAQQGLQDAQAQSQGHLMRQPVLDSRVQSIRATRDLYQQQYLQLGTRSLVDLLNAEQEYHTARFEQAESGLERLRLGVECLYQTDRLRSSLGLDLPTALDAQTP